MKLPEKTPNLTTSEIPLTFRLFDQIEPVLRKANNEYMYWDTFKHLTFPQGITPDQAWAMLKINRSFQRRFISLEDSEGKPFTYWLPDCVQKEVHFIDQQAGAAIPVDDLSVPPGEKKRYMMRSLVEEAISSSQIEGAATTRVVAKEMLRTGRKPRDRSEQMIFNNYEAMQMIKTHLKEPLTAELIFNIHTHMTKDTLDDPSWAGRYRTSSDDPIHVIDPSQDQTVLHIPPDPARIPALMRSLCEFANSDGTDEFVNPIVKGILLHFWLAYVHPFMDGNGRTARALLYWYMMKHDYWVFEYLSVSTAILSARVQYYRSFLYSEMDGNDATYFIAYNLKAIHKAIEMQNEYVRRKQKEKRHTYRLAEKYSSVNPRQRMLLASAFEKPDGIYTIDTHARIHGITYQTARTDLLGLASLGLLNMRKEGKKFVFLPASDLHRKLGE